MVEGILEEILGNYQKDLQDYRKLLQQADELIEKAPEKANINGTDINGPDINETLSFFQTSREKVFDNLKVRSLETESLRRRVCAELGIPDFNLRSLEPHVEPNLFEALALGINAVHDNMTALANKDSGVREILQRELEGTKLQLHRINGAKRIRQAYTSHESEAWFIDKTK